MKIAVAGTGYVGLSIATLLAQHHEVMAVDIIEEKVNMINNRKSPIQDNEIEAFLSTKNLNLVATLNAKEAYSDAEFVVIAAPTNYDSKKNFFDTSAVEAVIKLVMEYNPEAVMIIKSTIPVGYTQSIREKTGSKNIIFSPEFLRESKALYDNLYPSRIIVGTDMNDPRLVEAANTFAGLLQEGAIKEDIETLVNNTIEEIKQAIEEFDLEEFKETTGAKLSNLKDKLEQLANSIKSSDEYANFKEAVNKVSTDLTSTISEIKTKIQDKDFDAVKKLDDAMDDIEDELDIIIEDLKD